MSRHATRTSCFNYAFSGAIRIDPANLNLYWERAKSYRAMGDDIKPAADEQKAKGLTR